MSTVDIIARQLASKFGGWNDWEASDDSINTPSGNDACDEREYWRDIVRFVQNGEN